MPVVDGFPHTTAATSGGLNGRADAVRTRSVQVGGRAAAWDARAARWSIADVPLNPGINHLLVQSFDAGGQEMDRTYIDVWRDTGATQDVAGPIATDTTWSAAAGPYQLAGEVTVAAGATLTIEPGTSVYFDAGAQLTVRGRLVAEGNDLEWIRFTRTPGSAATWNGVQFVDTSQENRIAYAVLEYGVTDRGMIGLVNSRADLNYLLLDHTNRRRIELSNASMTLRNSTFTDMFGPEEPPNNVSEQVHGVGIASGGQMIIENNWFGTTKGHNDVIDFSGPARPGPILQVLGNTFTGSGDELLDLGGDAYIEGNLFQNVHKDEFNTAVGDANAISTGDDNFNANITVVRNVFRDVDHAVYLKGGTFMVFENNTVIDIPDDTAEAEFSAINFVIPGRDAPGRGALLDGNIFVNIPQRIFGHVDEGTTTDLVMRNSLVPP
ncbi:MAG: right-handed parallel beta-helix repeat-containing protein, partial [Acidimicrobiia bacterium]